MKTEFLVAELLQVTMTTSIQDPNLYQSIKIEGQNKKKESFSIKIKKFKLNIKLN
jgi:hypothetical protein